MSSRSRRLEASLVVAALSATVAAAAGAAGVLPVRQRELVILVRQDCGSCHGMTLKGGLGRPLSAKSLAHFDSPTLAAVILDGIPGTPMPPWRGLVTEAEAQWIADRLKEGFPE